MEEEFNKIREKVKETVSAIDEAIEKTRYQGIREDLKMMQQRIVDATEDLDYWEDTKEASEEGKGWKRK